jgi:hypothetical protein
MSVRIAPILALCAAGLFYPTASAAAAPRKLTLEQLIADPQRYTDGDNMIQVRVRGQLDNCIGHTCQLCPEDMTPASFDRKRCLHTSFAGQDSDDGPTWRAAELSRQVYRFATITIDAWFDPVCLPGYKPEVYCTGDRAFREARVVELHSRKTARDGLVGFHLYGELVAAPEADRVAMLAAYARAGFVSHWEDEPVALITPKVHSALEGHVIGVVCACREPDCADKLPTRHFAGMESPANPFYCRHMEKGPQGWAYAAAPDDEGFAP